MSFLSVVRVALGALLVNKGRSFLTSLGIVIGIGAVIALVSAGDGVQSKLQERLATVGKNLILIRSGARTRTGAIADPTPLHRDDAAALRKQLGHLLAAVAEVQLTQRVPSTGTRHWPTLLTGSTPDLQTLRDWKLTSGRFFNREELAQGASVCVLGATVRAKLFPDDPAPVGRTLRVDRLTLRVVGVLGAKGRNPAGADQDDEIFLPITTLQRKVVGEENVNIILTAARAEGLTDQAMQEINRLLRRTHHVKAGEEDFDVASIEEMAELAFVVTGTVQMLVAIIAGISLVVGGIGIMNIMLVSVSERTREIGIRMAVGATGADVLAQFLLEAIILALIGGLVGITLGVLAAVGLAQAAGWPVVVSPLVIVIAVGVAAAVGVFFGFYPAWRASRLDPIVALRYE